jgi:hypothetical protein
VAAGFRLIAGALGQMLYIIGSALSCITHGFDWNLRGPHRCAVGMDSHRHRHPVLTHRHAHYPSLDQIPHSAVFHGHILKDFPQFRCDLSELQT